MTTGQSRAVIRPTIPPKHTGTVTDVTSTTPTATVTTSTTTPKITIHNAPTSTHSGTSSTATELNGHHSSTFDPAGAAAAAQAAAEAASIPVATKGVANGVATLGATGKVPTSELPTLHTGTVTTVAAGDSTIVVTTGTTTPKVKRAAITGGVSIPAGSDVAAVLKVPPGSLVAGAGIKFTTTGGKAKIATTTIPVADLPTFSKLSTTRKATGPITANTERIVKVAAPTTAGDALSRTHNARVAQLVATTTITATQYIQGSAIVAKGTGGVFAAKGTAGLKAIHLRPNGRLTPAGQVTINTTGVVLFAATGGTDSSASAAYSMVTASSGVSFTPAALRNCMIYIYTKSGAGTIKISVGGHTITTTARTQNGGLLSGFATASFTIFVPKASAVIITLTGSLAIAKVQVQKGI